MLINMHLQATNVPIRMLSRCPQTCDPFRGHFSTILLTTCRVSIIISIGVLFFRHTHSQHLHQHACSVIYVFGASVPHPIRDITVTRLSEGVIEKLRHADDIVTQTLNGLDANGQRVPNLEPSMERIQQMPVVLIPVQFNLMKRENLVAGTFLHSIVLRPFLTNDFMTGQNALPGRDLPENVR